MEGNIITQPFKCNSPILFSLYINDLVQYVKDNCNNIPDIFCLMYADDTANCADTANNLQLQRNAVSIYCQDTGMQIDLEKTESIF